MMLRRCQQVGAEDQDPKLPSWEHVRKKSAKRSTRTLEFHDCLWSLHLW